MVLPINSNNGLNGLNPNGVAAADLYGRVSSSLISKNASVQKLSAQLNRDQTRLSGLGQLQSALADFQSLTKSLSGVGLQTSAVSSKPAVLTALTTATAKLGTYAVDVEQLAQSQILSTRNQRSQSAPIGGGAATTVKIEFGTASGNNFTPGSTSKTLTIDSSNNSLQGIAAALKAAGVEASVVKSSAGYALRLAGESGSSNSLRISVGGDDSVQKLLAYNPVGVKNLTETQIARDAILTVDGKRVVSASNVVTGQIPGTALALAGKGASEVVVGQANTAIAGNVSNFVSGFNSLAARLDGLRQGELKADGVVKQAQERLVQLFERNQEALAGAGVTLTRNGTLSVDTKVLNAAVAANPQAVSRLFTDEGKGLVDQLGARIGELIGDKGSTSKQKVAIDRGITALASQKSTLTKALTTQANALVAQYAQISGQTSQSGTANGALPGLPGGGATSLFDFLA